MTQPCFPWRVGTLPLARTPELPATFLTKDVRSCREPPQMADTCAALPFFPPVVVIVGGHSWQASTNAGPSMNAMIHRGRTCRQISFVPSTPWRYPPALTPLRAGRLAPSLTHHGGVPVAFTTTQFSNPEASCPPPVLARRRSPSSSSW